VGIRKYKEDLNRVNKRRGAKEGGCGREGWWGKVGGEEKMKVMRKGRWGVDRVAVGGFGEVGWRWVKNKWWGLNKNGGGRRVQGAEKG